MRNPKRQLDKLYKERHNHAVEDFKGQISILKTTIEAAADAPGGMTGARIRLGRDTTQTIAVGGEPIEWTAVDDFYEFSNTTPATVFTVPKTKYYGVLIDLTWDTYAGGGRVWVVRTLSDGAELVVWPTASDLSQWTDTKGDRFVDLAAPIPLLAGDLVTIYVDHNDSSTHDLLKATASIYAIESDEQSEPPHLGVEDPIALAEQFTVATENTAAWNAGDLHEPDGVKYDPATGLWVVATAGHTTGGFSEIGIYTSADGVTFTEFASNPVSGGTNSDDPYIAKNVDGTVWRNGSGEAFMFAEERTADPEGHRGIDLWKSDANSLTVWTRFGRVIDRAVSGWDSTDRTSPVVIWTGSQFVMLYEGRDWSSQQGQIGYATSADGETWVVDTSPIITQGAGGSWNDVAVVCDDVIKIGDKWVLLTHGDAGTPTWSVGRWETTDDPADWDSSSFVEMDGNPIGGSAFSDTLMCWGNDPHYVLMENAGVSLTKQRVELA